MFTFIMYRITAYMFKNIMEEGKVYYTEGR